MFKALKLKLELLSGLKKTSKILCGKNKIVDLILTKYILKIPFEEYFNMGFYNKSWSVRSKYIFEDKPYYSKYNPGVTLDTEDDKIELFLKTKDFMKRKIVVTQNLSFDDFKNFIHGLTSFFYKPANSYGGIGIEKIYLSEDKNLIDLYNHIIKLPIGLLEETVVQHNNLDSLCPNILQTIRFCVFKHRRGPKILFATLKTSMFKEAIVDNATSGGVFANINLVTGKIQTNAYRFLNFTTYEDIDKYGKKVFDEEGLEFHPISGVRFKGFEIPYFEEASKLAIDVASKNEFCNRRLLGIDIAISKDGPDLIEVNTTRPGITHLWQVACKSIPLRPMLEKMLKE